MVGFRFPFNAGPLLGSLLRNESGGRNITQGNIGDINNKTGDLAKGYFQITGSTWRDFGGGRYTNDPLKATPAQQAEIASKIPLGRWGPNTIKAMRAIGKPLDLHRTLGENLRMNGENFSGFGAPQQGPTQSGMTLDYGNPQQGPTRTGATLDTVTPSDSSQPPTGLFPPMSTELAGADKQKSLGGLLGEMQQAGDQQMPAPPEFRGGGGGGSAGGSLSDMIQQYLASQMRGGKRTTTPQQGGSSLG